MPSNLHEITATLEQVREEGSSEARSRLLELTYQELRRLASALTRRERPDHTLNPTALVHEAYLRIFGSELEYQNRAHFFAVAAGLMRRVLVDHAKARSATRKGGATRNIPLEEIGLVGELGIDLIELDAALSELTKRDPRAVRVVEHHFFAGLSLDETAEVLGISRKTANKDWVFARAWMFERLKGNAESNRH